MARTEGWDYEAYLAAVLAEEVSGRESHGGENRVKAPTSTSDERKITLVAEGSEQHNAVG